MSSWKDLHCIHQNCSSNPLKCSCQRPPEVLRTLSNQTCLSVVDGRMHPDPRIDSSKQSEKTQVCRYRRTVALFEFKESHYLLAKGKFLPFLQHEHGTE